MKRCGLYGRKEINKKIRHQPQDKLPEAEVERSILELVRYFASKSPLLAKVVARLNVRLQQRLPKLSAQRRGATRKSSKTPVWERSKMRLV